MFTVMAAGTEKENKVGYPLKSIHGKNEVAPWGSGGVAITTAELGGRFS